MVPDLAGRAKARLRAQDDGNMPQISGQDRRWVPRIG